MCMGATVSYEEVLDGIVTRVKKEATELGVELGDIAVALLRTE